MVNRQLNRFHNDLYNTRCFDIPKITIESMQLFTTSSDQIYLYNSSIVLYGTPQIYHLPLYLHMCQLCLNFRRSGVKFH